MDCDRTHRKITKLDNFIVFAQNLFCPAVMLGTFFLAVFVYVTAEPYALCTRSQVRFSLRFEFQLGHVIIIRANKCSKSSELKGQFLMLKVI